MPLTPEEEAELAELEKQVGPEFRALAAPPSGAVVDQPATPGSKDELGGIKAVYGKDWTPYGAGGQPISQTQTDKQRDEAALQAEAERVAGMLDPRFSIVPQVLALQPATNDLQGDEAAKAKFEAGQRDPIVIYEPPVDVVRQQLLQNPALLRAVSPDAVPTQQEIAGLTADSQLYQTTADYMYNQADKAATEKGLKIARYSKAPWLTLDPAALKLKVGGADSELANQAQAFILGVDDMGAAGAGRAVQEGTQPTTMLSQSNRLGTNSSVPQSSAEVNAWTEEEYPLSYGAGQVVGMLSPRSVFNKLWGGLESGALATWGALAKTPLGARAGAAVAPAVKGIAGTVGNTATGAAAAGGGQLVQESVDALGRGEGLAPGAGERVLDTAETGGVLSLLGSGVRRLSGVGADTIRDSPRFSGTRGPGAVRRTEPNMDYRLGREPRLSQETKALVKESNAGGYLPGDVLAEEIAGPVGKAAAQNERVSADRAGAVRAAYQRSAEGGELVPVQQVQETALEKVRSHYQPQPGGGLRSVNDRPPPAQKVFNTLVDDVSTTPVKGASKLDPDEAENFLGTRARYKILQRDIEASREASKAPREPIQRDEFLQTIDSRKRAAVEEEIDAAIDDVVGDVTPTPARRAKVEQEVLREFVDEASFREANGTLGDHLRQRGIDAIYVTPRKLDARRTDTLIDLLAKDDDLSKAATRDRGQFKAGGKKGGYNEMLDQQATEAARHKQIAEDVAPKGNAFQPVAGLYQSNPGEKQLVDKVKALADQSGVSNQLDRFRGLQETLAVQNRASFRGPQGQTRYAPTNFADAAYLRGAFPALKALEGPLGPLRGSSAGRPALMGGGETDAAQSRAESGARGRYEAERDRRLKEIADAKAREDQERQRRQTETIRRR